MATKLEKDDLITAMSFMYEAAAQAVRSTCHRSRCGSVVVSRQIPIQVIGRGFNSPPGNKESQRRCSHVKDLYHRKVTDKTCCVHAEERAIMDGLGSDFSLDELYFVRVDEQGIIQPSDQPYCTICSKLALDVGIESFYLWHSDGIYVYDTEEYNNLSYEYKDSTS